MTIFGTCVITTIVSIVHATFTFKRLTVLLTTVIEVSIGRASKIAKVLISLHHLSLGWYVSRRLQYPRPGGARLQTQETEQPSLFTRRSLRASSGLLTLTDRHSFIIDHRRSNRISNCGILSINL